MITFGPDGSVRITAKGGDNINVSGRIVARDGGVDISGASISSSSRNTPQNVTKYSSSDFVNFAYKGDLQKVRECLKQGLNQSECKINKSFTGSQFGTTTIQDLTPFLAACAGGHLEVAKELLKDASPEVVRQTSSEQYSALHIACFYQSNIDMITWLVESNGLNFKDTDKFGKNPLYYIPFGLCPQNEDAIWDIAMKHNMVTYASAPKPSYAYTEYKNGANKSDATTSGSTESSEPSKPCPWMP